MRETGASIAASDPIHLLKANDADEAPFADFTLCGERVTDITSAMWPGDTLAEHHIRGRWCPACKAGGIHERADRTQERPETMSDLPVKNDHWVRTDAQFPERWSLSGGALVAAYMGSMAHGTHLPSTEPTSIDDIDIMTVVAPPRQFVYGLRTFEHWVLQKDELDVVAYSLRKWVGLLLKSNPNVVGLLWLPERCYIARQFMFDEWLANRERFLSKLIYKSFCGYAKSQLHGLGAGTTGRGYMGKDRKLLVHKYGYDLKHGAHCVRLLRMGTEALETGHLNVDRTDIDADDMKAIKRGEWTYERLRQETDAWEARMDKAWLETKLPDEPDYELAEKLILWTYEQAWKSSDGPLNEPIRSVANPRELARS